jgi:dolichol-phosphate mannosyltransferase
VGFSQGAVHYERAARHAGETKYPVLKSVKLAWDAITSFSGVPLRYVMVFGFVVATGGVLLALRIIVLRLLHPEILQRGWASLAALTLFVGGIQLFCIGLLGQYVSRVFEETKKRPLYLVKETAGDFDQPAGASSNS